MEKKCFASSYWDSSVTFPSLSECAIYCMQYELDDNMITVEITDAGFTCSCNKENGVETDCPIDTYQLRKAGEIS